MMRPVLTREEYMALRDSEENRRAEKRNMVQMNYSCLPTTNDDDNRYPGCGPLKGCTTPSNTVGMDIDEPIDSDFVLSKKEELGLLMFENSATKPGCGHIVFRRHPEMTQEENLRWASKVLGVEYDKGAKDITRVFYTPADKLVYLDDELFRPSPQPSPFMERETGSNLSQQALPKETNESLRVANESNGNSTRQALPIKGEMGEAQRGALHAFDLCVQNAGLKAEEMDIWGEHNWHSNLMAVLSVGLPKLMSKEQLLAVVAKRLPNYSQTEDCHKLIEYFYENYTADKGFMSSTLRDINAKAQRFAYENHNDNENENEDETEIQLRETWTLPVLPKKIPRLMELLVSNYDPRFREMLLLSALPVLSAHASHFRATYLNGRVIGPQQYVSVIDGSGQGKGNCTSLYQEMVQYTLQDNDEREWQKVKENAELRDKKANAKERPPKYHPRLRLFETTSKSSILELQTNLGRNGMLLGQFSEVDGLSSASRAAYSDISVLLRKGGTWTCTDSST